MRSTYRLCSVLLALTVALAGLGCDDGEGTDCTQVANACATLGEVQCNAGNTGTERCEEDANGCAVWTAFETCGGSQTCEAGLCRCENTCTAAGDTQCNGSVVQTCTADALGCLSFVDGVDCATTNQICDDATGAAACVDSCTSTCDTVNATQCTGNTVETCTVGANGCNSWVVTDTCDATEVCDASSGTATCVCVPDCGTRECGMDPVCGTLECGTCDANEECDADGICQPVCVPDCTGKECGDDGCGGSCGTCTVAGEVCVLATGQCEACTPDCTGRECGPDPVCGASCGTCGANEECDADGICQPVCVPDCTGKECGDDGCGGSCGTCTVAGEVCVLATGQCEACTPDCTGLECGPDPVCGASCGDCTAPETCDASGQCVCTPNCTGRECGDDGCGGSCGTCTAPETCDASGQCVCTPNCTGRECGDDGCGGSCGTCTAPETCDENGQCVGGGVCTETVTDGGFEAGPGAGTWTESSTNYGTPLCDTASCGTGGGTGPHAGTYWAWFGGYGGGVEEGTVSQSVTLPAGTGATLFFYLEIAATAGLATDFISVRVDGNEVFVADGTMQASYLPYTLVQLDLSAYADGAAHTLEFYSYTNAADPTNFFVDDISLMSGDNCCMSECTVGEPNVCQGDQVFACVDTGGCALWTLDTDCTLNGEICVDGACVACVDRCTTENETQCNGDVVETCTLGGNGCLDWVMTEDCAANGEICDAGACVACLDTCSPEGATQCNGQIAETCSVGALGCLEWTFTEDCSLTADTYCIEGACQTISCTTITGTGTWTGDNTGYPDTATGTCSGSSSGDVCFTWTAPADGVFVIDTEGSTGTGDTVLWVLDAAGVEVACDDDGGTGYLSIVTLTATGGAVYTIYVDTWAGSEGAFNLNISAQICTPGEANCNVDGFTLETCNASGTAWTTFYCQGGCVDLGATATCLSAGDTCATALEAIDGDNPVTNLSNTDDSPAYSCVSDRTGADTWFYYTALADGDYWIATSGPGNVTDTVLAVFDACGGAELGCSDDEGEGAYSLVTVSLTAGQTIYIIMEPYSSTMTGTWNLNISAAIPEDICDDWTDNDADGLQDCADPTGCQSMAICIPVAGATAAGTSCEVHNTCSATMNDPACLIQDMGWPLGYCTEYCNLAADDCPAGSVCTDLGLGAVGACMDSCDPVTDPCRADTFVDPDGNTISYVCYTEYGNICGPSWWGGK